MRNITLVTGGCRSGKSAFAEARALSLSGPRLYLATCHVAGSDQEMRERVLLHQHRRQGAGWETREEPVDLASALNRSADYPVILLDSLGLWVSNFMFSRERAMGDLPDEGELIRTVEGWFLELESQSGDIIFVTDETGLGIVPENKLARRFRDLVGRCNQLVAEAARDVIFMVSGQPLTVKGEGKRNY